MGSVAAVLRIRFVALHAETEIARSATAQAKEETGQACDWVISFGLRGDCGAVHMFGDDWWSATRDRWSKDDFCVAGAGAAVL